MILHPRCGGPPICWSTVQYERLGRPPGLANI